MSYFRPNVEQAAGYEPGFQPKEAEVVKLNTNENPYPPSPAVMAALRDISPEQLRRYPEPLADLFRQVAAELLGFEPENIICCNGGDDLLRMAFRAFCDKDRAVAYPVPSYSLYPVLAKVQGCRAIEIPFSAGFDLPAGLAETKAALMILCNPNAPSGSFIGAKKIASLVAEVEGVLLVDEAYVDFADENCAYLVKDFDNLIVLRSMSKGYSLAGIRFGYGIAQKSLIKGLEKVRDSYPVDAVAMAVATAAIKDQEYFRENVQKVRQQRRRLVEQLRVLGFDVQDSSANFILAGCKTRSAKDIYEELVQRKIYVRYFELAGIDDKLRITVGTSEQNDKLLESLKDIASTPQAGLGAK